MGPLWFCTIRVQKMPHLRFARDATVVGDERWKHFFKLMSSYIAGRETNALVPDTLADQQERIGELRALASDLRVENVLSGWGVGINVMTDKTKGAKGVHSFLLVLNSKDRRIRVLPFSKGELQAAQQQYLELEKENNEKPWMQSVLVSVDSVAALRRAYPNFYLDSLTFSKLVEQAIGPKHAG